MRTWTCASMLVALVAAGPALAASNRSSMSDIDQRERQITQKLNEEQLQHPGTVTPMTGSSGVATPSTGGAMSGSSGTMDNNQMNNGQSQSTYK